MAKKPKTRAVSPTAEMEEVKPKKEPGKLDVPEKLSFDETEMRTFASINRQIVQSNKELGRHGDERKQRQAELDAWHLQRKNALNDRANALNDILQSFLQGVAMKHGIDFEKFDRTYDATLEGMVVKESIKEKLKKEEDEPKPGTNGDAPPDSEE